MFFEAILISIFSLICAVGLILSLMKFYHWAFKDKTDAGFTADRNLGLRVLLNKSIEPYGTGAVKIGDLEWTVVSDKETERIEKGRLVEIIGIKGSGYIVRPVNR